jgi:hypothetical protein
LIALTGNVTVLPLVPLRKAVILADSQKETAPRVPKAQRVTSSANASATKRQSHRRTAANSTGKMIQMRKTWTTIHTRETTGPSCGPATATTQSSTDATTGLLKRELFLRD